MAESLARRRFALGAAGLLVVYAVVAGVLGATKDFTDQGPLSLYEPALRAPLEGGLPVDQALRHCFPDQNPVAYRYRLVGGTVDGRRLYGCFERYPDGRVSKAAVADADSGTLVSDVELLKAAGIWPWIGLVKSGGELVFGGGVLAALLTVFGRYYRRLRPGTPIRARPWQSNGLLVTMSLVAPGIGWLALALFPGVSRARKVRAALQSVIVGSGILLGILWFSYGETPDLWGGFVLAMLNAGYGYGLIAGRLWLRPDGFGMAEDVLLGDVEAPAPFAVPAEARPGEPLAEPDERPGSRLPTVAPAMGPGAPDSVLNTQDARFRVQGAGRLPSFGQVGGMSALKRELKQTIGLSLAFAGEAEQYRITWNGLLLHGPPGVGKTFMARATAGEFGLNFIPVSAGDLVSAYRGESARNIGAAFRAGAGNLPCILFFDEFDAIAQRRRDVIDQESRRTVTQLLASLEEWRSVRELIVMAATNALDRLDEAVTRPGRFDRHIRVDLPDAAARRAIFTAQLQDRPTADGLDLDDLARRSDGLTPAAITRAVEAAALSAFQKATQRGTIVRITTAHLVSAISASGGTDRPTVEQWTWDRLVLPAEVKRELVELQLVVRDPERARAFGVSPPSGVLLSGPPGTGKTTIAKVLAAQSGCSFYPVTSSTITSMWLGESEQNITRLFQRARDHRPSIVFIDEIDGIAAARGEWGAYDRVVNQLLAEMDGLSSSAGVLVVAATNRPDQLDPALLRGGRLSKTLEIGLPDREGRRRLLEIHSEAMPLAGVDLDRLAGQTGDFSGADIKALCQQAALHAMTRGGVAAPEVIPQDFAAALVDQRDDRPGSGVYI